MPPARLSKTPSKSAGTGKDIRAFFGGASAGGASGAGAGKRDKGASARRAILISDDEDDEPTTPVKPKAASKHFAETKKPRETSTPVPIPTTGKRKKHGMLPSSDEEDDTEEEEQAKPPPKKKVAVSSGKGTSTPVAKAKTKARASTSASSSRAKPKKVVKDDDYEDDEESEAREDEEYMDVDEEEEEVPKKKTARAPRKSSPKKEKPTKSKATAKKDKPEPKTKATKAKPAKDEDGDEKEEEKPKQKFNWAAAKAAKLAGPSNPGSKAVPEPASPDCLAGLAFVFTGELSSFSREEAVDLAKRFGGRVTGQPSSKTSFVVLGEGAGPSKLAAIKKHNLRTLSEDEFLNLIATRKGPSASGGAMDEKTKRKLEKEMQAIKQGAKEIEQREKMEGKGKAGQTAKVDRATQLWTDRYAPQSLKEICGNKGQVEKLQAWLHDWPNSLKSGFKKPGKNGMNLFRGVMISGPPGIGKTTSAHLVAKLEGFTPIELNASDARSKKLVESSTNITNTSLDGWMGGGESTNVAGIPITDKSCLIMDEVDGMSAGDRGGVGALSALIKKTKIPIICIANDRGSQKMKPLVASTFNLPFQRPPATAIRSRILTIAYKENMKIPGNVVDQLVTGVQSDIRQVLNMLSTWKLSSDSMDFDDSKALAKMNEKYSVMTPFNVTQKILGPYLFSRTSRETLNDKMELYFHDYSFVPLFIQENYLKTKPAKVGDISSPPDMLKQLELMDQAASSISDGDLVDAQIHGPEQHWTLMPTHAVLSTVRPASFIYGTGSGYGGANAMSFPQWLGQNSKHNKLSRELSEVQIRMRLKVSGDKSEIRQSYIPALFPHIVEPLIEQGSSPVDDVIGVMDEYYLNREGWDTIVELGVGDHAEGVVQKKISTATKTALTKKYNARDHPIPFHKAQDLGKAPKKLAGGPAPDLEEAFDADDEVPEDADDDKKKDSDSDGIEGDSLIKQAGAKKGKAAAKSKAGAGPSKSRR